MVVDFSTGILASRSLYNELKNAPIAECPILVKEEIHPNEKNRGKRWRKDVPETCYLCKAYSDDEIYYCSKKADTRPFQHLYPARAIINYPESKGKFTIDSEVVDPHYTNDSNGRKNIPHPPKFC